MSGRGKEAFGQDINFRAGRIARYFHNLNHEVVS